MGASASLTTVTAEDVQPGNERLGANSSVLFWFWANFPRHNLQIVKGLKGLLCLLAWRELSNGSAVRCSKWFCGIAPVKQFEINKGEYITAVSVSDLE